MEGLENIPKDRPCVFVANHRSYYDIPLLLAGLEKPHGILAKEELEKIFLLSRWMKLLGCVFVQRDDVRASVRALNDATAIVESGRSFVIFPEGTRSKDHKPGKAKSGIARIALASHADILPVSIYNSDDMKKHTKMTIRFGKLIPFEELKLNEDSGRTEIHAAADYIMSKINELWSEGHCE